MKNNRPLVLLFASTLLITLLTSCSNPSSSVDAKKSAEPSQSPSASETTPYDPITYMQKGKARVIQNALDEEFLDIAHKSCLKAYQDGLIYRSSIGTTYYLGDPNSDANDYWKLKQVTVANDNSVQQGVYLPYLPAVFDPCDMMIGAGLMPEDSDSKILEHSLIKNKDGSYTWGQHHGGANLDLINYFVGADGLFSQVGNETEMDSISYGPFSQEQLEYFK